jgi:hypothetical protein
MKRLNLYILKEFQLVVFNYYNTTKLHIIRSVLEASTSLNKQSLFDRDC